MRWNRLSAAISMSALLTAGALAPASAAPSPPKSEPAAAKAPAVPKATTATVRLITGDLVTLGAGPDGKQTASVRPGPGRTKVVFQTLEHDGSLTVLPSDAAPLVNTGTLDRELFDVSALVAQGYDQTHSDALPLIVGRPAGLPAASARRAVDSLASWSEPSSPSRELTSINARSLRVADKDLGAFWHDLAPASGAAAVRAAGSTPRIQLDAKVSATLDRSTAQINAPAAWDAGYQGQGVKVAVLDTGVDRSHPDLAGRVVEAKDFSGSGNTDDHFGHGTHVASIAGGSGAASGGSRKGVAYHADLVIGKVLGDDGTGSESQIIEGMQWAVAEGAKVVSMSLGTGAPSDGTDAMSEAVNELTRSSGALFVVAAGNEGESGTSTVSSPGAADEALTVGAVDRDDSLAPFSSRGPRTGDGAVKPDVTAPGVGIVAARAAGTSLGDPVDENYTSLSGTSMATPHVAGAAALLAQEHPGWRAQDIKDALISTAHTVAGQKPTEQGGGRIDLAAATRSAAMATGTVDLGSFSTDAPAGNVRAGTIRYTNTTDQDVSLELTATLATDTGRALPADALALGSGTVRVPARGTATVPLDVDPARAGQGEYYGYVTATSTDGSVVPHTTASLTVHGPLHKLTVKARDLAGEAVPPAPTIWGAHGFVQYPYDGADPLVIEVEEGTYQLSTTSLDTVDDGFEMRAVVLPEVRVTKDTTVTMDARRTTQVKIRTPKPAEQHGVVSYQIYRSIDGNGLIQGVMFFDNAKRLYVSPTARVTDGAFEYASRWQLQAPLIETSVRGTGISLDPYYTAQSPLFADRGARLTAVDAGSADDPDLRPARVRGKLAVIRDPDASGEALAAQAAGAGAAGLLLVSAPGYNWTVWNPVSAVHDALPVVRVGATGGASLLALLKKHAASVGITGTARSPYLYDVMQVSSGQVPKDVVYTVSDRDSARLTTTYAENGGSPWSSEQRFGWRPYQDAAWNQYTRDVPTGFTRTEYVSSGDTLWQHFVNHKSVGTVDGFMTSGMRDAPRTYRGGEHTEESWFASVVRPSIPRGAGLASTRTNDTLHLLVPEYTDAAEGHWSPKLLPELGSGTGGFRTADAEPDPGDTVSATLYRDGTQAGAADSSFADFQVAPGAADYRLDVSTQRASDEWTMGVRTDTSWSFRSDTTATDQPLPLLQVDYDVPVDASNAVHAGRSHDVALSVRHQDGLAAPKGVTLKVETSFDDGRTFGAARVEDRGAGRFTATVARPSGKGRDAYVTLRVTARDKAGDSVRQTVERAYLLRGR
ncbi:S8 family serine peptidase [Streptomyces sp. NBC_01497]|uniref:S8 family serine peptidase n=1 Tax=Streptomyces sp. NBC_01497 TaxID=2903885 RepID=UPI002E352360|nr:S8 family serine peptidase [Streptomyces sp. NBC_01497]